MKITEEWLFELGYDDRDDSKYGNESSMVKFMRDLRKEHLREAQDYMDSIEDCSDDYYINLKNRN